MTATQLNSTKIQFGGAVFSFPFMSPVGCAGAQHTESSPAASVVEEPVRDGFCYDVLFQKRYREAMRLMLGPWPTLNALLLVLDASIMMDVDTLAEVRILEVGQTFHLGGTSGTFFLDALAVWRADEQLLGTVGERGAWCVGGVVEDIAAQCDDSLTKVADLRGRCEECGFEDVLLEGHQMRCRPRPVVDAAGLAYLGDAMVTLDVRRAVVACEPEVSKRTTLATQYLSGNAQRRYLDMIGVQLNKNLSDHRAGDVFESRYAKEPGFREGYLVWLARDLMGARGLVFDRVMLREEDDALLYGILSEWLEPEREKIFYFSLPMGGAGRGKTGLLLEYDKPRFESELQQVGRLGRIMRDGCSMSISGALLENRTFVARAVMAGGTFGIAGVVAVGPEPLACVGEYLRPARFVTQMSEKCALAQAIERAGSWVLCTGSLGQVLERYVNILVFAFDPTSMVGDTRVLDFMDFLRGAVVYTVGD